MAYRGVLARPHLSIAGAGVPFQVNRVAVDFIGAEASEGFLAAALEAEPGSMIELE